MLPARDELRRRVRAAAAEATSEREFLDALRDVRVLVRPRYAEGGRERVVGYSVALPPVVEDGRRATPVWHGAGRLDKSLALGQLRARWGADVAGDPALTSAWTQRWTTRDVADKVRASEPPRDAARALAGLSGTLGDGGQRLAAADAAGVFARASIALEKDKPGPLAKLSDDLARAAQPSAYTAEDRDRQRRENAALGAAYVSRLMARGTGSDSRTGWIAVMRHAERTARAVAHAQALQGRAAAASQTNRALAAAVASVPQLTASRTSAPAAQIARHVGEGAASSRDIGMGVERD